MSENDAASGSNARGLPEAQVRAALAAAEDPAATPAERAEMLMEIAVGLQHRPRTPQALHDAIRLYDRALALCPPGDPLLPARIRARKGTALQALPPAGGQGDEPRDDSGADPAGGRAPDPLEAAIECFREAREPLFAAGTPEEVAEIDLNLGLATQALAGLHRARIQDAIAHYHRALKVFGRQTHPREFAILHNNLAIAYLSIPGTDERGVLRESLAVQSFQQVLSVVTLVDHPTEYAMAQNNLGNALQYAPSSHPVENLLRALAAYDEALKVRNARDTPVEYANTLANKANALCNLPDDPADPAAGNARNRAEACRLYREARTLFLQHGMTGSAQAVSEVLAQPGMAEAFGEALVS